MKTPILKVFLGLVCLALSGLCHATPNIVISNTSSTQSVFVISNCTIQTSPYINPLAASPSATPNFAEGGFGTYYYIGKGLSYSLTWTVPSSKCVMEIPGINSYLYFDSTGVSQDGSSSYLFQYPSTSSISSTTMTTGLQYYTVTYSASSSAVTFTFSDYSAS